MCLVSILWTEPSSLFLCISTRVHSSLRYHNNVMSCDLLYYRVWSHTYSEHGVSRSVTVVLAYLMWSEGRSFHVLFDNLKKRKPDIRWVSLTWPDIVWIIVISSHLDRTQVLLSSWSCGVQWDAGLTIATSPTGRIDYNTWQRIWLVHLFVVVVMIGKKKFTSQRFCCGRSWVHGKHVARGCIS